MRHINKKTIVEGAGLFSKPKPKPPILRPPKLAGFRQIASYAVAEIIDLISDGPIDGLVDQNGKLLSDDIFKGIYLDNTPIRNTETLKLQPEMGSLNLSSQFQAISNVWIKDGQFIERELAPIINVGAVAGAILGIRNPKGSAGLYLFPTLQYNSSGVVLNYTNTDKVIPKYLSFASGRVEIHHNPKEIFTNTNAPYYPSYRAVSQFKSHLNQRSVSTNEFSQSFARDNLKKLAKFESSASKIPQFKNIYFIIEFEGYLFTTPKPATEKLFFDLGELSFDSGASTVILTQPEVNDLNQYTGKVRGLIILTSPFRAKKGSQLSGGSLFTPKTTYYFVNTSVLSKIASTSFLYVRQQESVSSGTNNLFNFSNVSCQFKNGEEFQLPLNGFDTVRNDYYYDTRLYGPFIRSLPIQRIDLASNDKNIQYGMKDLKLTVQDINVDGSVDLRGTNHYSDWNDRNEIRDYESLAITHNVENPFVKKIAVSISLGALFDTAHTDISNIAGLDGNKAGTLTAGAKMPTVVGIRIEIGKITNGSITNKKQYTYLIGGISEGGAIIDFGGDYADPAQSINQSVKIMPNNIVDSASFNDYLNTPFELPELTTDENPTITKRYVKIVKLSAETNSSLINKDITLHKVTEIINEKFSYPFCALVASKFDATALSSVPERSFDCRLKKIKIPNNYFPISNGIDKRYIKDASTYTPVQLYIGDWDGQFTEGWTDNPAWILYDILTSQRYGLGSYINESQINKWELYKIARFCDTVDDNGYFIGVSDGVGGLEPRYSCNILFKQQTKVYDAINLIANLFRGVVFFGGSEIHFLDDRPRNPIALFSNTNVRDGVFNYSNTRRDQQFNAAEIFYLDRFDNYKTKVEYIQDEEDIRKRGVFKTTINTAGITSRAMARRVGQHLIYQTIKENQGVEFKAGLESLLCRPGDLIVVEDEMKTRSSNYGRVLSINVTGKELRIDNQFDESNFTGYITLYSPTGYSTSEEMQTTALRNRGRVEQFAISGLFGGYAHLSGIYKFSGYTSGFSNSTLPEQFPLYTGRSSGNTHDIFCYYNTGATGFVFATGRPFQDNNSQDILITNTGVKYGIDIYPPFTGDNTNYTIFAYNSLLSTKRGSSFSTLASSAVKWNQNDYPLTNGILPFEIDTYNISQITKIALTGYNNLDYGSIIRLNVNDPNTALLSIVKEGSPYRIERKNASDQIYKIVSIREDNQNEYTVSAMKYDTGKFEKIEKFIKQDYLPQTYYTGVNRVGTFDILELASPTITSFVKVDETPSNFKLSGVWSAVAGATGYRAELSNRITSENFVYVTGSSPLVVTGLRSLGNWDLSLLALGNGSSISSFPSKTGVFVAYSSSQSNATTKPAITKITIN